MHRGQVPMHPRRWVRAMQDSLRFCGATSLDSLYHFVSRDFGLQGKDVLPRKPLCAIRRSSRSAVFESLRRSCDPEKIEGATIGDQVLVSEAVKRTASDAIAELMQIFLQRCAKYKRE